jgi:hypothetical protein
MNIGSQLKIKNIVIMEANIAGNVVEMQVRGAVDQITAPNQNSTINWNDYNYPPCLHLVHFSLSELQGTVKRFALNVYLSFIIIIVVLILNGKDKLLHA